MCFLQSVIGSKISVLGKFKHHYIIKKEEESVRVKTLPNKGQGQFLTVERIALC